MIDNASILPDVLVVADQNSRQFRRELRKATAEFEGIMLAKMLEAMKRAIPESELFGGQFERGIYEDMLGTEIANMSARTQGMGIGDLLYRSFVDKVVDPDREPGFDLQRSNPEEVGE